MYEVEKDTNVNEENVNSTAPEMNTEDFTKFMQEELAKSLMKNQMEIIKTNPELIPVIVKTAVEKYKPIVYACLGELVGIYKDYVNNTEYFALCAQEKKNIYDAYIKVGFSDEQAFAFMMKGYDNARKLSDQLRDTAKNVSEKAK